MNTWKSVAAVPAVVVALIFTGPIACSQDAKTDQRSHDHAGHAVKHDRSHDRSGHAAQHDRKAHDHSGHSAASDESAETPAPRTYADAIQQLRAHMKSLDAILKSGDHDAVHKDSVAIGKIGESLGALASAPESPVPQNKVKDVTTAGADLRTASRTFHKAAHNDDLATVKADYAHMNKLIDSLARHVPQP